MPDFHHEKCRYADEGDKVETKNDEKSEDIIEIIHRWSDLDEEK